MEHHPAQNARIVRLLALIASLQSQQRYVLPHSCFLRIEALPPKRCGDLLKGILLRMYAVQSLLILEPFEDFPTASKHVSKRWRVCYHVYVPLGSSLLLTLIDSYPAVPRWRLFSRYGAGRLGSQFPA